jgi:hypothetical protein
VRTRCTTTRTSRRPPVLFLSVGTAQATARWHSETDVGLDHATLTAADEGWLAPVKCLTLWAVDVSDGLLASLPNLVFLDIRGGSASSAPTALGCEHLRYLQVNQVRGLSDLSVLSGLPTLEALSLYGLPKVVRLPSFAPLGRLTRVVVGSMKGLQGLSGLHEAPALEELLLVRSVGTSDDDAQRLATHPTLEWFDWFGEDVPVRRWKPFVETVGKRRAAAVLARDWFAERGGL